MIHFFTWGHLWWLEVATGTFLYTYSDWRISVAYFHYLVSDEKVPNLGFAQLAGQVRTLSPVLLVFFFSGVEEAAIIWLSGAPCGDSCPFCSASDKLPPVRAEQQSSACGWLGSDWLDQLGPLLSPSGFNVVTFCHHLRLTWSCQVTTSTLFPRVADFC